MTKTFRPSPQTVAALALVASLAAPGVGAQQAPRPGAGASAAQRSGTPALRVPAATPAPATAAVRSPSVDPAGSADFIVAVVNSEPVTNQEVRSRVLRAEQQARQQGAAVPARDELVTEMLNRLIDEKAQQQLAREVGIKADEAAVDDAERSVARRNGIDVAELRRRLAADGIRLVDFREDLRNQVYITRLREREIEPRVRVSEAEVDQFLREQGGQAAVGGGTEINLAHLLVAVPEDARPAQVATLRDKAQRAADRARAGEDFGALVRELSDARELAAAGGQMGLRTEDRYPPLFVDAVRQARPGDVAGPLQSGAGFHVLKLIEKRRAGAVTATITQSHARHVLLRVGPQLSESAALAQAADLRRRIASGQADFAAIARQYSQDGSAARGGDLGWVGPGTFVPEFEEVLNRLSPGDISPPFASRFGVHLVQLIERRQQRLNEREQRDMARGALREKKLDEAYATWAQEVRGRAYVEMRQAPRLP